MSSPSGDKNGRLLGDAIVFLRAGLDDGFEFVRKQGMQLASKMRYLERPAGGAARRGGPVARTAEHANHGAGWEGVRALDGVELVHPVEANGVFAHLPREAIDQLMAASRAASVLRLGRGPRRVALALLVDTTEEDVDSWVARRPRRSRGGRREGDPRLRHLVAARSAGGGPERGVRRRAADAPPARARLRRDRPRPRSARWRGLHPRLRSRIRAAGGVRRGGGGPLAPSPARTPRAIERLADSIRRGGG